MDAAIAIATVVDARAGGLFWRLTALLDLQGQGSIARWYCSMQLFLIAVLLAAFARHAVARNERVSWLLPLLPLMFAALSFDEIARLHELFRFRAARIPFLPLRSVPFYYSRVWTLLVGVPFAVSLLALGWLVRRYVHGRPGIVIKYLVGLLIFVGSAAAVGFLAALIPASLTLRAMTAAAEELGKMVGGTVMLWATYDLVVSHEIGLAGLRVSHSPDDRPVAAREPRA